MQNVSFCFDVIVVESSADRQVEDVVREMPQARLIRSDVGLLPGAARNLGAQYAVGDILAFTDSDCEPDSDWLKSIINAIGQGAKLVGGVIGNSLPLHPIAVADNLMQCADFQSGRPNGATDALPGGNLAIRRSDFADLGGFREDLATGEDTLLVELASRRWPGKVIFDPQMQVLHRGRTTLGSYWRHQEQFGYHRGILGLRLRAGFRERGHHAPYVIYLCIRRFAYFLIRTIQWQPLCLPRFLLITPFIAFGLGAYGKGFLNGCRMAVKSDKSTSDQDKS